jgi:hypothetical protein
VKSVIDIQDIIGTMKNSLPEFNSTAILSWSTDVKYHLHPVVRGGIEQEI